MHIASHLIEHRLTLVAKVITIHINLNWKQTQTHFFPPETVL